MSFTSVLTALAKKAYAGMVATINAPKQVTAFSEEASAEIPFGYCVKQGTADDGVLMLTANTDLLKGIAVLKQHFNVGSGSALQELGTVGLKPNVVFDLATEGELYVAIEENVTPASNVRVRFSQNGGVGNVGAFRATADAGHTFDISKFCTWQETATGSTGTPGVARLKFNFANRKQATAD